MKFSFEELITPLVKANLALTPQRGTNEDFPLLALDARLKFAGVLPLKGSVKVAGRKLPITIDLTESVQGYAGFLPFLLARHWLVILAVCVVCATFAQVFTMPTPVALILISMTLVPFTLVQSADWVGRHDVMAARRTFAQQTLMLARELDQAKERMQLVEVRKDNVVRLDRRDMNAPDTGPIAA